MKVSYYLGNNLVGEETLPKIQMHYYSTIYVCRVCGESWGRIIRSDSANYYPISRRCPTHGAGYLLRHGQTHAPTPVLKREVYIAMHDAIPYELEIICDGK